MTKFFGKYRGSVINNIDPQVQGRIQVSCPAVLGSGVLSWAMPCAPFAGPGVGFFAIPPIGANVWVEFEAGDPDYPIWAGGFWGIGEFPIPAVTAAPGLPTTFVFKTNMATITLNDLPGVGGLVLESASGAKVQIDMTGIITIDNGMGGSIVMLGPNVSINNGALDIT